MGLIIRAFWEIKITNKWICYSRPNFKDDYRLFSKMTDIRLIEGIKPISKPKGIPKDASDLVKLESSWDGADKHHESWLNPKEITQLYEFHTKLYEERGKSPILVNFQEWGYLNNLSFPYFDKFKFTYPKEVQDIRLVFWFIG